MSERRPAAPELEYVFEAKLLLGQPMELGTREGRRHRFIPIVGGAVSGPRLTATILPGGGDRQSIASDGMTVIDARYFAQAEDGTVIGVDNRGVRVATPDIIARLTAGEDLDPSLYYFRTTPRFDVVGDEHAWLREGVFIGRGVRHPDSVVVQVFRVG